jgi:hypothetical protein
MKSVVLALLIALFGGAAMADDIAIANGSFQTTDALSISCGTGCAYNYGPIPDWTVTGGQSGSQELNSTYYTSTSPSGPFMAYSNGSTISQTLTGVSLLPDSVYTLSVYVGDRLDGENTSYSVSLDAGATVLNTFSGLTSSITPGTFQQEFVTFTTGGTVTPGDLSIQLTSAGLQTDFADVDLTVQPVGDDPVGTPEPGTCLMLGMGLLGILGLAVRKQAVV